MRAVDLIMKKKLGRRLTSDEMAFLVGGYVRGEVPDYQMSAFLMAVYFRGLDVAETVALTEVMRDSGDKVELEGIDGIKVDKHSTGGVGDKTTLALAPLLASCGEDEDTEDKLDTGAPADTGNDTGSGDTQDTQDDQDDQDDD